MKVTTENLQPSFTEAMESFRNQLTPLGTKQGTPERELRVITPVLSNANNGLRVQAQRTETLAVELAPTLEAAKGALIPGAKQGEHLEYKNADSLEDSKGA